MAEPSVTSNVKLLDSNYQTVAKGTLGWGIDDNTASGVLNLAGSGIVVDGASLTGVGRFFVEQQGNLIAMGTNVLLTGPYGDTTLSLMFTSWGDSSDLLGYFLVGEQEPAYIIVT
jgi:hypothetical protein